MSSTKEVTAIRKREGLRRQRRNSSQVSVLDLQKLLIFDLIFSNLDRNGENYKFQQGEGIIKVFGIDNESCMKFHGPGLKMEYIGEFDFAFNQPFMPELNELLSTENLETYQDIMEKNGMGEKAINWMNHSANIIRDAIDSDGAIDVFKQLSKLFANEHAI